MEGLVTPRVAMKGMSMWGGATLVVVMPPVVILGAASLKVGMVGEAMVGVAKWRAGVRLSLDEAELDTGTHLTIDCHWVQADVYGDAVTMTLIRKALRILHITVKER